MQLEDDGAISIRTDARMGFVRVVSRDDIAHRVTVDALDQTKFREIFNSYLQAMLAPTPEGYFSDT